MSPPDPNSGGPVQNYDVPVYVPTVAALQALPAGLRDGAVVWVTDGIAPWTLLRINPPAPNGLDIVPFLSASPASPQPVWCQGAPAPSIAQLVALASFRLTASFPAIGTTPVFTHVDEPTKSHGVTFVAMTQPIPGNRVLQVEYTLDRPLAEDFRAEVPSLHDVTPLSSPLITALDPFVPAPPIVADEPAPNQLVVLEQATNPVPARGSPSKTIECHVFLYSTTRT